MNSIVVEAEIKELFTAASFRRSALSSLGDGGAESVVVDERGVEVPDCSIAILRRIWDTQTEDVAFYF